MAAPAPSVKLGSRAPVRSSAPIHLNSRSHIQFLEPLNFSCQPFHLINDGKLARARFGKTPSSHDFGTRHPAFGNYSVKPPSMVRLAPVMYPASSPAK